MNSCSMKELHGFLVSLMNDTTGIEFVATQYNPITGNPWVERILTKGVVYEVWIDTLTHNIGWNRETLEVNHE